MEWHTAERAIKTETDTRTEQKGVGKVGWFMSKTKPATSPPREGELAGTSSTNSKSSVRPERGKRWFTTTVN